MKKSTLLSALAVVFAFCLLLLYGTLSSSDFPRAISDHPSLNTSYWSSFDSLNQNRVLNGRGKFSLAQLPNYLNTLAGYGMQSLLSHPDYNQMGGMADSLPYLVEHYSWGQYDKLQVEWNEARLAEYPDSVGYGYYYHFKYWTGDPISWQGALCVYCPTTYTADSGKFLYQVQNVNHSPLHEPKYNYPNRGGYNNLYPQIGRKFRTRIRMAIDTTGCNVSLTDTVLDYRMSFEFYMGDSLPRIYRVYPRVCDFPLNLDFKEFWVEGQLDTSTHDLNFTGIDYAFYTTNQVKLYIDWVEYMDMEQAYPLVWNDSLKNITVAAIRTQCRELLASSGGGAIVGWSQSDEPWRMTYRAHGIVNDSLAADDSLRGHWPQTVLNVSGYKRPDHFINVAHPRVFDVNRYVFADPNLGPSHYLGSQVELDSLASMLSWSAQVCPDTVPLYYTGSVTYWPGDTRHPKRSEIFAQAFMALAYGAKGIHFYKYTSDTANGSQGLVDVNYSHNSAPFAEKWQAVRDVFTQLDSLGETLQDLILDTAYCAKNGGFQPPIDSVRFSESDTNFIEVGQFLDADTTYLILVNRRTNADRHITVKTELTGTWALRDLYTQERFVSSTGNFEWIPFDSGQGRVFKVEGFSDWTHD